MKRILTMLILYLSVISVLHAQSCPDSNHPHAIDLGIGVKFACCNVGASSPEQYGCHYAWGETEEKGVYDENSYPGRGDQRYKNRKYVDFGTDISGTRYDVAYVKWGLDWRMPTKEQLYMLRDRCKKEWITYKHVEGCRFIGPNGHSIFLPASGCRWYEDTNYVGYSGGYWSSTLSVQSSNGTSDAYFLFFDSGRIEMSHRDRASGSSVRPVKEQ
jgi:hypothetical protein